MSTLFITQRFPPHRGPAARRLGYWAQRLAESDRVLVISTGPEGTTHPAVEQLITIPCHDLRSLAGQRGKTLPPGTKRRPLIRWLLRLRQAFPFVLLTDDGGIAYRRQALREASRLVREEDVTTVFSSFRPWSDHLVARRLQRRFPALRWIADFRDLPVDPVRRDSWWPALQRWWGKWVIRRAAEVWVVSAGQQAQFADWHPRVLVRRNALLQLPPASTAPVTERFTIVYTGSLYAGLQTIAPVVQALQELLAVGQLTADKVCLCYRGKDAALFREWTAALPPALLDIKPSIAPAAAQKMQREAQVLLLLNWSAPGYYGVLTAKLWDYLATGRPILALVNGPGDQELEALLEGANAGAVFRTEAPGEVKAWLGSAYATWAATGRLPWSVNPAALQSFTAPA